jgi:hypothetical protein
MPKVSPARLIVIDRAQASQLNAIHTFIAANANGWWHHMSNVWLVGSDKSTEWWREQIRPFLLPLPGAPTPGVLVLALPPGELFREWAYFGPNDSDQIGWLHDNYQS